MRGTPTPPHPATGRSMTQGRRRAEPHPERQQGPLPLPSGWVRETTAQQVSLRAKGPAEPAGADRSGKTKASGGRSRGPPRQLAMMPGRPAGRSPQSRRGPWFCGDGPRVPPRPAPTLCGGPEARESRGEQRGRWAGGDAVARETERRGGRSVGAALGTKIRDGDTGARGPGGERDRQGAPRPAQRWRHRQTETRARTETRTETRRDGDARSARATPGPTHAEPRAPAPATHRGRRPRGAG